MSVKGWLVNLPSPSYSTPSRCASCFGPKETEMAVQATSKSGNIRTTLTMRFPYCAACMQRATSERTRGMQVFLGAMLIGAVFGVAFAAANVFVGLTARAVIAAIFAVPAGLGLAFLTRPEMPPQPATARGDAIWLRDTRGTVLCTNEQFANALAQANRTGVTPSSKTMTTETWSPFAVLLGGGMAIAIFASLASRSEFDPARAPYFPLFPAVTAGTPIRRVPALRGPTTTTTRPARPTR